MTIDATFWVALSFFAFLGILIYFKLPQKIKSILEENISSIKNQISEAEKLKEEAKSRNKIKADELREEEAGSNIKKQRRK